MNKTARSFSIVTGFAITTRLISFIFKIWMSRALGAEVIGLYQIASSVMSLLFTLTSGAPTVLSRKIAEAASTGDTKRQNSYLTASALLGLAASGVAVGALYACGSKLGFLFSDKRCLPIFLILLPTLVSSTLYASFRSWFWGRKNFLAFSSTELLDEVVKILLSVIFAGGIVQTIRPEHGIALAMTVSDVVCVLVLAVLFLLSGGRFAKPSGFKELALRAIPLSATRIVTSVTASVSALIIPQQLIMGGLSVSQATAQYGRLTGMALPLIMAPVMLVSSLSVVLIPDVAQLKAQGDIKAVKSKLSAAMTFAILIASVFFVLYLPLGEYVGKLIFGDAEAGRLASNCSVLLFPIVTAQVTTPMLNSLGREKCTLISTLIGSAFLLPCVFFLPKYVGVYAMAIGSGGCFVAVSAINIAALKKEVGGFADIGKLAKCIGFSVPLAALGLLSQRLMSAIAGELVTTLTLGVLLLFLMFVLIGAFDVADVTGYLKMLRPTNSLSKRGKIKKRVRHKK